VGTCVGEDTARLGGLVGAVQRHAELDAGEDGARVERHGLRFDSALDLSAP